MQIRHIFMDFQFASLVYDPVKVLFNCFHYRLFDKLNPYVTVQLFYKLKIDIRGSTSFQLLLSENEKNAETCDAVNKFKFNCTKVTINF
ncbi:hypothetical protein RJT34_12763 [Clitoria ternatea]|uniref:Uncharacterized protein n=1 Tax=Clitoria ternatea TaxID=43366 RepID=A0AAN9JPE7_CLITE